MLFRNDEITKLLRTAGAQQEDGESDSASASVKSNCDVSYVIFLEPRTDADPNWTTVEWLADEAIKRFSPAPALAHCELVLPPIPDSDGGRIHYATYLGRGGANWQNQRNKEDGISFYLIENGARWRALPVFGPDAVRHVREAAHANLGAPYSIAMYPTSAKPLRAFSGMWSDAPAHKGHCAVLSARVLKQAGLGANLPHPSAWYSPSSLYNQLSSSVATPLDDSDLKGLTSVTPLECQNTIDTLLRAPMSYATVRALGDSKCIDALRTLTLRVCSTAADGDEVSSRIAQKQLATVLLRWALLRDDGTVPDTSADSGAEQLI